ncbi:uncharacterized protein yc1106_09959 [Curvularia clavata]|uniref:Major facilitator superfamily (MFS) profile domain-containing protein n=1 Tax=Curvularia clavata TaxID=95742 RepID=A0A9Q8ZJ62_CURCL|nr:uncharacterized protein yc1106_09959 [Curvularia clavata]
MTSHSATDEKNIKIDDKAVSQEEYSRPSSASQNEEAVVEPKVGPTRTNDLTPDQEAQADVRSTFTAESGIPPAPDGGLHAWLKVFGGFLIYINIWGFTLTYGIFQTYYRTTLLSSSSASSISWIGTVQAWLLIVIGVLSGPLFDLGYFRSMLLLGNFLVVFGIMMLSLSTTYWQVFLSQGICMGLGAGLLYIPSLAMVGVWFDKRRNVALGIVMSGIAVGAVIYIVMFDRLLKSASFPWAIRAIGFVALVCALLSIPALLSGSGWLKRPRKRRVLFDKSALKDRLFLIFTACSFATFLGYNVPYVYIPTYAREKLGSDESTAMYMLVMAIAGSFFGRLATGIMAHYIGPIVTWAFCTLSSGILALSWMAITEEKGFRAFSILWGFFSAGLVTVPSAAFASITPDLSRLGTRLGMSWSVSSVATLIGAPIGGALLLKKNGDTSFVGVQVWSGVFLLIGTCFILTLWTLTVRKQNRGWKV